MAFKNYKRQPINLEQVFNQEELAYMISIVQGEGYENKLNRAIDNHRNNLEALNAWNEVNEELKNLQEEYFSVKDRVNTESLTNEDLDNTKILYSKANTLAKKIGADVHSQDVSNFEDISINMESLFGELANSISQGFSAAASAIGKSIKAIATVFSSATNHRRKKLLALKAALQDVNKFDVPKQVNDDFVADYLCMLKLSDYNVEKTFAQIDPLQDYVKSMMGGKYPSGSNGIGAKFDVTIPEIRDRAEEIKDFITYRNYSGMKLADVICVGYENRGETVRAYLNMEFRVPKANITKAVYSFRDFNKFSYQGIDIIDGSDVIIRRMQNVVLGFRNEHKVIKFDKSIALRQIDAEMSRVDRVAKIILQSNWQDIVKSFQGWGAGFATAFEKAIPMGLVSEINAWSGAMSGGFIGWFMNFMFSGTTFSHWMVQNYVKAYSGLVEMSKSNYEMLVDYSNAILNNQK